eukprot:gene9414-10399_t
MEEELALKYGQLSLCDNVGMECLDADMEGQFKSDSGACNLIVNYLPHDVDDHALRGIFQDFGEIIMTKVVRDKNTKKSMGYGFVKFMKESDAIAAIEKMNGFSMGHKNLKVSVARPPSLEIRNCKLYVTNLPKDYDERDVVALFKEFGEIIECRVLKDRNSKSNKGVAFVQFNVKSQANNALSLNGCQLEGSSRPLVVKYAEDQHKKKELSRLHNLTINNAFRRIGMGGGMLNPMAGGSMPSPKSSRLDGKGDMMNHGYYYQQQGMPPSLYASQTQPMSLLPSPMNAGSPGGASGWFNPMQGQQMPYLQSPPMALNSAHHPLGSQSVEIGFNHSPHLHALGMAIGGHAGISPSLGPQNMPGGHGGGASPMGSGLKMMGGMMGEMEHHHNQGPRIPLGMGYPSPPGAPMHHMPPPLPNHGGHNLPMPGSPAGQQFPTVIISQLPPMADVNLLHELCAPYGRIVSANLEDSRRPASNSSGSSSNASSPGSLRGRIQMESLAQAEIAAQNLHGLVLYDGAMPLHIQLWPSGRF